MKPIYATKLIITSLLLTITTLPINIITTQAQTIPEIIPEAPVNYFLRPPKLIYAGTTQDDAYVYNSTYYFTIDVPEDSRVPLTQIILEQREGVEFNDQYFWDETRSFYGTRSQRGEVIPLASMDVDYQQRTITITFSEPIAPNNTITIGLRPVMTPGDGIYLWRVWAVPPAGIERKVSAGLARFHFYWRF